MRLFVRAALLALALTLGGATAVFHPIPAMAQAQLIDINTASKETLETLKGIGPARADAIIKGRPYKGKDDLVSKKLVPKNVYDGIKDKIVARQKS
jgi:DNA uptake protein ComE-like DNA-binding protein